MFDSMYVYTCVYHKYTWYLQWLEKNVRYPQTGVTDGYMGAGNWTQDVYNGKSVLNYWASAQPHSSYFKYYIYW